MSSQEATPQNNEQAQDTVELREIIVERSRPISKIEGDGLVTLVQGSVLQNLGSAIDVLGYIPGVTNNNGSISVIGKGAPIIYINGRLVRMGQELEQLKSDRIKEIKLINNPGARYGGEVNSVIRITTIKNIGDGFSLDSRSVLRISNYIGTTEDVSMNYRTGGVDIFGVIGYNYSKIRGSSDNVLDSWLQTHQQSIINMQNKSKSQHIDGKIGMNYTSDSGHDFGFYYHGNLKPTKQQINNNSNSIYGNDNPTYSQHSGIDNMRQTDHLVDAYYSGKWGNWNSEITFDVLWRNNHRNKNLKEDLVDKNNNLDLSGESQGRLIGGEIHLSRPFFYGNIGIGAVYSNSDREDIFTSRVESIESNSDRINEGDIGIYAELSQSFKWMTFQFGLRYEHIYSNYYQHNVRKEEQSRKYNEFLPSVTIVFPIKKAMLQISYSRKYNRPLYSQLSSSVSYINEHLYESGNPYLRSSFTNNLSLNFRWEWLVLMCNYRHVDNQIISSAMNYGSLDNVTLLKKVNSLRKLHNIQVLATLAPGLIKQFYYPMLTFGAVTQLYNIQYRELEKRMDRPIGIIQFNNIFMLPQNFTVTGNVNWSGRGDAENISLKSSWQLNFGVQKKFNNHWNLKLTVNDIFNSSRHSGFILYSDYHQIRIDRFITTRYIELTANYKFNTTKSNYKGKGTAKEEQKRL